MQLNSVSEALKFFSTVKKIVKLSSLLLILCNTGISTAERDEQLTTFKELTVSVRASLMACYILHSCYLTEYLLVLRREQEIHCF